MTNQKLELTWIGKDQRPRLEPRILLQDAVRGYRASVRLCCGTYRGATAAQAAQRWPNLTIKKIPKIVKDRCESGQDDYSLNVANLPMAARPPAEPAQVDLFWLISETASRKSDGAAQPGAAK